MTDFDADTIGRHALVLFLLLLAIVTAASGASWWLLHRAVLPRVRRRLSPPVFLVGLLAAGLALLLAGGAAFAEIVEAIGAHERIGRADTRVSDAIAAHVAPGTLQAFAAITRLGDVSTLTGLAILVALVLLWQGRRWMALGWSLALAGNGLLNQGLKHLFERARPVHEHGLVAADGFSFPSGHSSGSVVAYGMLAYLLVRRLPPPWHAPVVMAAGALAFTIASSRVFLQVHFPSDVVAGLISGSMWLLTCVAGIELLRRSQPRRALENPADAAI